MSKRKSIVSAFGDFRNDRDTDDNKSADTAEDSKPKANRVAAGIIGTTQRTLTQIREERDALLEQATSSHQVISLDPSVIDPSPFRDRLPDDDVSGFEEFKQSLSAEGQKVPITVRRHPSDENRFQIVYGHRRCRALKELGQAIDAIVTDYSDRDLVIAQGIENASRQDLSWIERALFAQEMQEAGIKPKDIKAALTIDDAELSKLRSVAKSVPTKLLEAIGRAPSVGRPRWLEFSGAIQTKGELSRVEKTLSSDKVRTLPSDDRFAAALAATGKASSKPDIKERQLAMDLEDIGSMSVTTGSIKITLAKAHRKGFSEFLEAEMEGLVSRYKQGLEKE